VLNSSIFVSSVNILFDIPVRYHNRRLLSFFANHFSLTDKNKKLSWCWQTRATRLEVSQGHQT